MLTRLMDVRPTINNREPPKFGHLESNLKRKELNEGIKHSTTIIWFSEVHGIRARKPHFT